MQLLLAGLVAYGLVDGQPKAIVNGSVALLITFFPALLERNYDLPLDPWLGLWITAAVFLHTLGSAGLYGQIEWWDHLTHALSASLVAGVGYTAARAVDLHAEDIHIPRRVAFVYIFVLVMAFGVIWELFEFALDIIAASTGVTMPLAQHGLDDTVRDLMYNSLGALLVATFGQVHLTDVAETVREHLLSIDS
jgi:AcrR family transcriptional regulator